ncbi:MAG: NAD-dependent epimerase/dehydratase family protein [Alphaproteobacteria bacterium]|nr:NAD-dependent epimerase/dehydratase family protein [Alphaproteobacteria bacterium]
MTTLITGGCGFIGRHLTAALLGAGEQVIVLDDLSTGDRSALPKGAELVVGDITTPDIFDALVAKVDRVFHLAAIASVERSRTDWHCAHTVNIGGTVNLFHTIAKSGRKLPVVYASSAAVYGDSDALPLAETTPVKPLSAYGADKYACEVHGRIAADLHGIPNAAMRFFNVYGPGQDPKSPYSGVISIFMAKARKGEPMTIFGDGSQSRDFVFVKDVVSALRAAMDSLQQDNAQHDVFNVGTGKAITIRELAEQVIALGGNRSQLLFGPSREGEILHSYCDNRHAQQKLAFLPATPLAEGLRITYEAIS